MVAGVDSRICKRVDCHHYKKVGYNAHINMNVYMCHAIMESTSRMIIHKDHIPDNCPYKNIHMVSSRCNAEYQIKRIKNVHQDRTKRCNK